MINNDVIILLLSIRRLWLCKFIYTVGTITATLKVCLVLANVEMKLGRLAQHSFSSLIY